MGVPICLQFVGSLLPQPFLKIFKRRHRGFNCCQLYSDPDIIVVDLVGLLLLVLVDQTLLLIVRDLDAVSGHRDPLAALYL